MERGRTLVFVAVGAGVGGLIGGKILAWALAKIIPYHDSAARDDGFGAAFGAVFGLGLHLGVILGVATTLGVCAGMWAGWLLARRTKRPMTAPMSGV